jgi:FkbM family methyltransferase
MMDGYWESWISVAFANILKKINPVNFINIGANLGYYSLLAASVLPNLRIAAYEPQTDLCKLIEKSAQVNGFANIAVHNCALGNEHGSAWLETFDDLYGSGTLASEHLMQGAKAVATTISTLDSDRSDSPELLLIDAEGFEFKILKGAEQNIKNAKKMALIIEFSASRYENKKEFVEWLFANNFVPYKINYDCTFSLLQYDELEKTQSTIDLLLLKGIETGEL